MKKNPFFPAACLVFFVSLFLVGCVEEEPLASTNQTISPTATLIISPSLQPTIVELQETSCANNSLSLLTGANVFDSLKTTCVDDCSELSYSSACDLETCTCTASCANNSAFNALNAGLLSGYNNFKSKGLVCADDCARVNPASVCDEEECICKSAVPSVSCVGNTVGSVFGLNSFQANKSACRNDCKNLDTSFACDLASCTCVNQSSGVNAANVSVSCASNSVLSALGFGSLFNASAGTCVDDCAGTAPDLTCELQSCTCIEKPEEVINASCSSNTLYSLLGGESYFDALAMECADDCAEISADLACDLEECFCVEPPITPVVDCSTGYVEWLITGRTSFDAKNAACVDDCEAKLGANTFCDLKECRCIPVIGFPPLETTSCRKNTLQAAGANNSFNPKKSSCQDDCRTLSGDLACDPASCVCVRKEEPPKETMDCSANTIFTIMHDVNAFNSTTMKCSDDCKNIDEKMVCNLASCTCTKPFIEQPRLLSCYGNTQKVAATDENAFEKNFTKCQDDCVTYAEDAVCDLESCTCDIPEIIYPNATVTCTLNTLDATIGGENIFLKNGERCIDDCSLLGPDTTCELKTCTCLTKEGTTVDCLHNSVLPKNQRVFKEGSKCVDNCNSLDKNMECDLTSCTCIEKEEMTKEMTCLRNTLASELENQTPFDKDLMKCVDNCKDADPSLICDTKSCECFHPSLLPSLSCELNTLTSFFEPNNTLFGPNMKCTDDCGSMEVNGGVLVFNCNPTTCVCAPSEIKTSCMWNMLSILEEFHNSFDKKTMTCIDDCDMFGPYFKCDLDECACMFREVVENGTASCAVNTGEFQTNVDLKGAKCVDDCNTIGSGYMCNFGDCKCVEKITIDPPFETPIPTIDIPRLTPPATTTSPSKTPTPMPEHHTECTQDLHCISVPGPGENQCETDDCCEQKYGMLT